MEANHKQFKPFQKVLVRDDYNKWYCGFYSHWCDNENNHALTSTGHYSDEDILPYEGNEHLVSITNKPDESDEEMKFEKGEFVFFLSNEAHKNLNKPNHWKFGIISNNKITEHGIIVTDDYHQWSKYIIKFSHFNPNDMEKTKKHILCVNNGKIVKYK